MEGWREKEEEELHRHGHGSASRTHQPGIWPFFPHEDMPEAAEQHPPRSGEHQVTDKSGLPAKTSITGGRTKLATQTLWKDVIPSKTKPANEEECE